MQTPIRCMLMRGGTSKGAYFLSQDLPDEPALRDQVLLAVMGSPDTRQIDGIGGGNSLTSKVAIVKKSERSHTDLDYLFAQVSVDQAKVDYGQNCGNILAGVVPFAIERGLIVPQDGQTVVTVFMENTQQFAKVTVNTPNAELDYAGWTYIDGVPQPAAEIILEFEDIAGSTCGKLLPTDKRIDCIDGIQVTCIDNGMPVVLINATDLGCTGYESKQELDRNEDLKQQLERIRLKAGKLMNLGNVSHKTIPKMCLISPAQTEGCINTRFFIPHQCHNSIGVFAAISVASACAMSGSVTEGIAKLPQETKEKRMAILHPSGHFDVLLRLDHTGKIKGSGFIRTARALFDGFVFIAEKVWKKN